MLHLFHLPAGALGAPPPAGAWLGAACFGGAAPDFALPCAHVQAPVLAGPPAPCEAFAAAGPLREGRHGPWHWRCSEHWWFGAARIGEPAAPLQQTVQRAYTQLMEAAAAAGFELLVRVWNHIAEINGGGNDLERYRQFNIGRQDAFLAGGYSVAGSSVPAASALGAAAGAPFTLYALATRHPMQAVENPRQTSAYHYPAEYGPRSPTFSRATLVRADARPLLFISGTASIVGHQSLHAGDALAQTRETLCNLQAVLDAANRLTATRWDLSQLHYKVYVRDPADWLAIETELRRAIGDRAPVLALQADVCRSELLVEIEAAGGGRR